MFLINKNQYILKTSAGQLISVYHKPYAGLCAGRPGAAGPWIPAEVIFKTALPGFSAHLDGSDTLHVLCQDEQGNLLYIAGQNGSWNVLPVSENTEREARGKYPHICPASGGIGFFYTVDSHGKRALVFRKHDGGGLTAPIMLDYAGRTSKAYIVAKGAGGDLYALYIRPSEKRSRPGYRVLKDGAEAFGDFIALESPSGINGELLLSAAADSRSNLHICMQRSSEHKFELVYNRARGGEGVCFETVLASSPYSFTSSSILCLKSRLVVYWVREDRILYCTSPDNGATWSKPDRYNFSENEVIHIIRFLTNCPEDGLYGGCTEVPANISDGFKPAFIYDFNDKKEDDASMEEFESILLGKLNAISAGMFEMTKNIKLMAERLDKLEAAMRQTKAVPGRPAEAAGSSGDTAPKEKAASRTPDSCAKPDQPIIPGTGFSQITYEYLKNMDKR